MKLYLKVIKKLKEYSCNNSIRTHWKILGEVSLSNEESATICFWKLYGGVNTEYISHDKNHQNCLKRNFSQASDHLIGICQHLKIIDKIRREVVYGKFAKWNK